MKLLITRLFFRFVIIVLGLITLSLFAHASYAYDQGTCASSTSICYTGSTDNTDLAPGYQCGDATGFVYGSNGPSVPHCLTGYCCDPGTAKKAAPPHAGYDLGDKCNADSICYTGNYNLDHLIPGAQCGTLPDWHFGSSSGHVPACGAFNRAFCCDAGKATVKTFPATAPPTPCNLDSKGNCISVSTGFGKISTSVPAAIATIFGIFLSFAGGAALIIIVVSGYRIMTSGGEAEKLKGAREALTSAIIGLLFVIFSVTILKVIGVDILHIPGFTP